jgi:glucokinase
MQPVYGGVDLGGTNITGALTECDGRIIWEISIPTLSHEGPAGVLRRIAALVRDLVDRTGRKPVALGLGAPGLVDLKAGVTRFFPNLPTNWRDVPVRAILEPEAGCPVFLLNDVRAATLGELTFGHGRSVASMAFFALGTGVGGGIVIDGRLRLGPLGAAGELGHQTILPDGPRCGCGNRGCIEALASGPAISAEGVRLVLGGQAPKLHELVGGDVSRITPKEMAEAAGYGDGAVRDAIIRAAGYLGIGIANIVTAIHPDLIVLGGRVSQIGPLLFETVESTMRERVRMFPPDNVRIKPSLLGDKAGILGAIALAMRNGNVEG